MRRRSSATCSSASAHRRAPPRAGVLPSSRVGRCSALARERHALSRHSAFAQVLRALTRPLAPTRYRPRWERARTGAALQAHAHVYTRPRTFCSSFAGGLGSARLRTRPRSAPLDSTRQRRCIAAGCRTGRALATPCLVGYDAPASRRAQRRQRSVRPGEENGGRSGDGGAGGAAAQEARRRRRRR